MTHLSDGGFDAGVDEGARASAWSGAETAAGPPPAALRHMTGAAQSPSLYAASYYPAVDCKQHTLMFTLTSHL